jgi:hypothetical protein
MLPVAAFVHVRMRVDHAAVDMRVGVVMPPFPTQEQACRQKYDDQADRYFSTLKQASWKPAREQQQGNPEGEQCGCMADAPGQPEHAGASSAIRAPGEDNRRDGGQVVRIGRMPDAEQHSHEEGQ